MNFALDVTRRDDCTAVAKQVAEKVGPVGEGRSAEAQAIVTVEKHDWAGAMLSF